MMNTEKSKTIKYRLMRMYSDIFYTVLPSLLYFLFHDGFPTFWAIVNVLWLGILLAVIMHKVGG